MNEFRATPPKDDSTLPVPTPDGSELRTSSTAGLPSTFGVPVSADRGGRAPGLASIAGVYRSIGDKWLEAMNKQIVDSLKGGV